MIRITEETVQSFEREHIEAVRKAAPGRPESPGRALTGGKMQMYRS